MKTPVQGMVPLLQVYDMPTSLRFYRDRLGFEVVGSSGPGDDVNWVLLRLNRVELMLNTAYERPHRPATPDTARTAAHQDVTLYIGCADVEAACQELRSKGIEVQEPKIAPYGMKQLGVRDPDGYGLCLQWPVTEAAREYWRSWYGVDV